MSPLYYILRGHEVVPCGDLLEWARWFETNRDGRQLAVTEIAGYLVSTIFLGLDHRFFGGGPPIVFESMVFALSSETGACAPHVKSSVGGFPMPKFILAQRDSSFLDDRLQMQRRYATWDEAMAGHEEIVRALRATVNG